MGTNITVPNLGESIIEATVARWFKKAGEHVDVGEPLVELETDKVNLEVGAEQAGVLVEISHLEGEDVKVGEILGIINPAGAPSQVEKKNDNPAQAPVSPTTPSQKIAEPEDHPAPIEASKPPVIDEKVTPVARRFALEQGIDLAEVPGTGPGGRITRQDLEKVTGQKTLASTSPEENGGETHEQRPSNLPISPPVDSAPLSGERQEKRVKLSRRRRTIAQRLVEAQHNAAMLTTFNDIDMSAVMDIRQRRKQSFKEKNGVSLGIVSFFVKASIFVLKEFPQINSELQGDELVLKQYYDIGVAIGAEEGLIVPVLRNAEQLSFSQIEKGIQEFAQKAKENTLSLEDLRGGTFTITNGGVFGSLLSTPIINAPQVAILGLHRIEDRPVARNGEVIIRPMMYAALSYDHRIIDGREAVQFLVKIKEVIENPEMILLES